jgi:lysyl-tRNA synthetase class II
VVRAYADYEDTKPRIEGLVVAVARATIGTTEGTFRGHRLVVKRPRCRLRFLQASEWEGI